MVIKRKNLLVGGIEAGGTKFVCAVGRGPEDIRQPQNRVEFPTGDKPSDLIAKVIGWFNQKQQLNPLSAIGIASFGPVDLAENSPSFGHITSTPKPGWANTDLVGPIRRALSDIPVGFDTDVNGAGLGEYFWGNASGLDDFVYITIGTGIGAGGMARGQLLHGLVHPEMGHLRLPRVAGDEFLGVCPYHGDCWEGLCSGPAILQRAGKPAELLAPDDPAWTYETQYIGYAIANIVCALSPRRVIIGGSVRKAGQLGEDAFFRAVRGHVQTSLNKYVVSPSLLDDGIREYIVPPQLGDDAGVCGAIALGQCALAEPIDGRGDG
jgi:fructokinase